MALITCPECGKEISDQASNCVHCGYPLSENPAAICVIDGLPVDFSEMLSIYHNQGRTRSIASFNERMKKIELRLGRDKHKQLRVYLLHYITDHGTVPPEIHRDQIPRQNPRDALTIGELWMELDSSGELCCPRCGSRQVQKLEGNTSVLWNFLNTGAPRNVCTKCGHKFRP